MNKILLIIAVLFSINAEASTVTFCLNANYSDAGDKQIGDTRCELTQVLTWEDKKLLVKCLNKNKNEKVAKLLFPESLGYDYQVNMAYAKYDFGLTSDLGKFLFQNSGLNIEKTSDTSPSLVKIFFDDNGPANKISKTVFNNGNDIVVLSIKLSNYDQNCF